MEFRLLGAVEAELAGRPVALGRRRERCLLALLLLQAGRPVPAWRLADLLWDGHPPANAPTVLTTYVSRLRGSLAAADPAAVDRVDQPRLIRRGDGYAIDVEPETVDAHRFALLIERARACDDAAERARLLRVALAMWRGPPLAGAATDMLRLRVCAGLEQLRRNALHLRIEADLALGRHTELTSELADLVAHEPIDEQLAEHLMRAQHRAGHRQDALQTYHRTRQRLADELGLDPRPELQRLHQAILGGGSDQPVIRPPSAVPAQLPADIPEFTGRERPLKRLDELFPTDRVDRSNAVVISTITGTAGAGKTALAVHWAHRVRDRFPDGQLHIDLRGYAPIPPLRPIEALARFLRALDVPADQVPGEVDEAAAMYRSMLAGKRMLIVLDNARHAAQVRPLLPGSPDCLVLITSRDRLDGLVARDGARRVTLGVLDPDEANTLLGRLLGEHRVQAEPHATTELARLCGRLPLALRIAAANLTARPHQTIGDYVAQLRAGDLLSALEVGDDHRSAVRPAFDLSYVALSPDVQRLFRLLGQLPGQDITAEGAAALAATTPEGARRLLHRLTLAHLADEHAPGRYTVHDLLRRYAAERGATDEPEGRAARLRLFDHYVQTANAAATILYPQVVRLPAPAPPPTCLRDRRQATAWLDAERHNLLAAIQHAATHGPLPVAWQLADAMRGYFTFRLFTVEWFVAADAALAAAKADGSQLAQAAAELGLGTLYWRRDEYQTATSHFARALDHARQAGWLPGQASAQANLGAVYLHLGRLRQAAEHSTESLALHREVGSREGEAIGLSNLGVVHLRMGHLRDAAGYLAKSLEVFRRTASLRGQANALHGLGEAHRDLGHLDQALRHLVGALALHREVGDQHTEINTLCAVATTHRDAGRLTEALDHAEAALALARDAERVYQLDALNVLATIEDRLGQHGQAVTHHRLALELARQTGDSYLEAEALIGLATSHPSLGNHDQALLAANRALTIARGAEYRMLEGQALTAIAAIELDLGDADRAIGYAHAALDAHRETGHRIGEARTLLVLGRALQHRKEREQALPRWREALDLFVDIGAPEADRVRCLLG